MVNRIKLLLIAVGLLAAATATADAELKIKSTLIYGQLAESKYNFGGAIELRFDVSQGDEFHLVHPEDFSERGGIGDMGEVDCNAIPLDGNYIMEELQAGRLHMSYTVPYATNHCYAIFSRSGFDNDQVVVFRAVNRKQADFVTIDQVRSVQYKFEGWSK